VNLLRRRRAEENQYAGSLDPQDPPQDADLGAGYLSGREPVGHSEPDEPVDVDDAALVERPPSALSRIGEALAETRRRVLPLPDEVIDQYLGSGERMIHNDHPSFRSFVVQNTVLFIGFLVISVLFLGITFNGSFLAAAFLLLVLCLVLLVLVLKRLGDRYTSYVVTDTRIMRISGIISRRAHSIPWVRVTDLSIEQTLSGRLFGYATLHIESANEDSGLRDLDGVSDPMQFNQYVVDMVVAKQGSTEPKWVQTGEPAPVGMGRGLRRIRMSRRRRREESNERSFSDDSASTESGEKASEKRSGARSGSRRVYVGDEPSSRSPRTFGRTSDEAEGIDPETLASELKATGEDDLPWGR
jgi:membrane protein YdbS with pleckstrin-like domain